MERGLDTNVRRMRHKVFKAIAELAYTSTNLADDMEALPYRLCNMDSPEDWDNVYRERAVVRERARLALGMSLRPENQPVHVSQGVEESNVAEKYYEPPLMQVIPSACNACPENMYAVSDQCMGCVAHPCMEVCPKGAISMVNGKSFIDQEKCIKCGKCHAACPYDAISHKRRPCADACGAGAITSDELGRAEIDRTACVSCGMCMVNCPFGAIADKSQIFQLIRAMQSGRQIIAEVAPAFVGQFDGASPAQVKTALKKLGFHEVFEVAIGADIGCAAEAKHYVEKVATGELPFLLTSCCPSWNFLAKLFFPEMIGNISRELTPMVATARVIKKQFPEAAIVFIGPCASKKLEASRRTVRSDVDFVITFEELSAIFDAKGIDPSKIETGEPMEDASGAGRGYGVAGGVASAIEEAIKTYYPGVEVNIEHAQGLAECKKMLTMAKAGLKKGCLIEGMACPGGCISGAGTNIPIPKANRELDKFKAEAKNRLPAKDIPDIE
ncbi:MAG: 4Fe-4S dicluster domain-containing protein [Lachnospiraceae bacterium]|nr:4Fe-4S dicluster domain-containing protein [Lachnospiraceae bacterium]